MKKIYGTATVNWGVQECDSGFKPIHALGVEDAWDYVNPANCYRFKDGFAQLSSGGYWFEYVRHGWSEAIQVNLTKPHVLVD